MQVYLFFILAFRAAASSCLFSFARRAASFFSAARRCVAAFLRLHRTAESRREAQPTSVESPNRVVEWVHGCS